MWSAGAPTTTREARVLPQTAAVPSLGFGATPSPVNNLLDCLPWLIFFAQRHFQQVIELGAVR